MNEFSDIETGLEHVYGVQMPADARTRIASVLEETAAPKRPGSRMRMPRMIAAPLLSFGLTLLVVLGGLVTYNHLGSPTPASAAQVLHRAALALTTPENAVVHETSRWTYGPSASDVVSNDVWTALDGKGNPIEAAIRLRLSHGTLQHVEVAEPSGTYWLYDAGSQTATRSSWTPGKPLFVPPPAKEAVAILFLAKQTMNSPQSPAATQALLNDAAQGNDGALLPDVTIDGHAVKVVRMERSAAALGYPSVSGVSSEVLTVYIDASTYLIRRIDMHELDTAGRARNEERLDITSYEIVSPSDVPPGTFTFTPPPGSHTVDATSPPPAPAGVRTVEP